MGVKGSQLKDVPPDAALRTPEVMTDGGEPTEETPKTLQDFCSETADKKAETVRERAISKARQEAQDESSSLYGRVFGEGEEPQTTASQSPDPVPDERTEIGWSEVEGGQEDEAVKEMGEVLDSTQLVSFREEGELIADTDVQTESPDSGSESAQLIESGTVESGATLGEGVEQLISEGSGSDSVDDDISSIGQGQESAELRDLNRRLAENSPRESQEPERTNNTRLVDQFSEQPAQGGSRGNRAEMERERLQDIQEKGGQVGETVGMTADGQRVVTGKEGYRRQSGNQTQTDPGTQGRFLAKGEDTNTEPDQIVDYAGALGNEIGGEESGDRSGEGYEQVYGDVSEGTGVAMVSESDDSLVIDTKHTTDVIDRESTPLQIEEAMIGEAQESRELTESVAQREIEGELGDLEGGEVRARGQAAEVDSFFEAVDATELPPDTETIAVRIRPNMQAYVSEVAESKMGDNLHGIGSVESSDAYLLAAVDNPDAAASQLSDVEHVDSVVGTDDVWQSEGRDRVRKDAGPISNTFDEMARNSAGEEASTSQYTNISDVIETSMQEVRENPVVSWHLSVEGIDRDLSDDYYTSDGEMHGDRRLDDVDGIGGKAVWGFFDKPEGEKIRTLGDLSQELSSTDLDGIKEEILELADNTPSVSIGETKAEALADEIQPVRELDSRIDEATERVASQFAFNYDDKQDVEAINELKEILNNHPKNQVSKEDISKQAARRFGTDSALHNSGFIDELEDRTFEAKEIAGKEDIQKVIAENVREGRSPERVAEFLQTREGRVTALTGGETSSWDGPQWTPIDELEPWTVNGEVPNVGIATIEGEVTNVRTSERVKDIDGPSKVFQKFDIQDPNRDRVKTTVTTWTDSVQFSKSDVEGGSPTTTGDSKYDDSMKNKGSPIEEATIGEGDYVELRGVQVNNHTHYSGNHTVCTVPETEFHVQERNSSFDERPVGHTPVVKRSRETSPTDKDHGWLTSMRLQNESTSEGHTLSTYEQDGETIKGMEFTLKQQHEPIEMREGEEVRSGSSDGFTERAKELREEM